MSLLRIVSSCMAHADETDAMPQLAETGRAGTPREHSITFDHVSFSYDQRPILRRDAAKDDGDAREKAVPVGEHEVQRVVIRYNAGFEGYPRCV